MAEYKAYPGECYYVMSARGLAAMFEDLASFFERFLLGGASRNDVSVARSLRVLTRAERENPNPGFERILGTAAHL